MPAWARAAGQQRPRDSKVTALLVFIALGFSIGVGSSANLQQSAGSVTSTRWLLAFIRVMFAYSGWNAAACMAEEIHDPGRGVRARSLWALERSSPDLPPQSVVSLRDAGRAGESQGAS